MYGNAGIRLVTVPTAITCISQHAKEILSYIYFLG